MQVTEDPVAYAEELIDGPCFPSQIILVEEHPDYPGYLVFQPLAEDVQTFYTAFSDWVSRYLILNELFLLESFVDELHKNCYTVIFGPSCAQALADFKRWSVPLQVENFELIGRSGELVTLHPYQQFTLTRAAERATADTHAGRFMMFGWGTGTGKSMCAAAGAQEMINRDLVDQVLAFTPKDNKYDLAEFFEGTTLVAEVNDGPKDRRTELWADERVDVFVNNYEKAHFDFDAIRARIEGRRTLVICDEVQAITTDATKTNARKALETLVQNNHTTMWAMSASVVQETPLNYRDLFGISSMSAANPLGTKKDFIDRYCKEHHRRRLINGRTGGSFFHDFYTWDRAKLHEVRHRVGHCTQNVRKTDPMVRDHFKGLQVQRQHVLMSEQDLTLYEWVERKARADRAAGINLNPHKKVMRYICNTPEALAHSAEPMAQELCELYPHLINSRHCAKLDWLIDRVTAIRSQGDKVVVFTKWTQLCLFILSREMGRAGITHVQHYSTGMSDTAKQEAKRSFLDDPAVTVFLTSDAGKRGLNLQAARYVINYECPYRYDDLMQRNNRIDRADSTLDGMQADILINRGTFEERIWQMCEDNRLLHAATTGTAEVLSYEVDEDEEPVARGIDWLLFGEEEE